MTAEMAKVRDAVKTCPAALPSTSSMPPGVHGPSDDSFLAEMLRMAGADPITTGSPDKYDIALSA
jgi:hypothetical protein